MKDPYALIWDLSDRLGLNFEEQDWGIVNADQRRLEEFIAFFEAQPAMERRELLAGADLILASANERLLVSPEDDLNELRHYLARNAAVSAMYSDYWRGLHNDDEFPLSARLREWSSLDVSDTERSPGE